MKKKSLKILFSILICAIMFISGGVLAVKLSAKDIGFTSTHEGWKATNVNDAMNDLYNIGKYEITKDTYFYDSNTIGEEIVRYKKVNGKYYLCDKNGNVTNEEEQDISNITLVEYTGTSEENLSVGKSGFSNSELILGNGTDIDNASSAKLTKTLVGSSSFWFSAGWSGSQTFTYNCTGIEGYENFTEANFSTTVEYGGKNSSDSYYGHTLTGQSFSYNNVTGILTVYVSGNCQANGSGTGKIHVYCHHVS